MKNGVSTITFAALIQAALTGTPKYNNQRFGLAVLAYARRMCRARAPDLPDHLIEDVAQEAIANLFASGPSALSMTPPMKLLRHAMLAAIRKVRADHAPPGQRTRRYREEPRDRVAAEDAARIPNTATIEAATVRQGEHAAIDVNDFPCPAAERAIMEAEQRITIDRALAKLPPNIAQALRLVRLEERPMSEVAALAGISRFVLHRRIEQHCAVFRMAA
ncbi:RNA polymerase sigma factor [Propylenella binzhouense]|uniref:Sigma-70 family RNA polymerase sigma factor n=1 Tax=Propylenella binzhouense TaxID=2555902 RepID=A0A964T3N4_9HYPH|nr:sigma-70 family RNA polymerase sigma factor [Propylenella binzhouense]MYZ47873.1 sigma-70 family RNA polymerase sigma factor [Propylenella binzhouense]